MSEEKTAQIIQFGKYKGQPLEIIAKDRPYMDWLTAQNWFRDQFPAHYNLIINNFAMYEI